MTTDVPSLPQAVLTDAERYAMWVDMPTGDIHSYAGLVLAYARAIEAAAIAAYAAQQAPIDMVLHCPACGMQHVDAMEDLPMPLPGSAFEGSAGWTNPPHRSHLCHGCGHIWRPADVPTNGVQAVKTTGKADSPIAHPATGGAEAVGDPGSQRRIDNDLLALIQRHFPNLPTSDEYTNWSQWLGFARAVYALASPAVKEAPAVVPAGDAVRTLAEQIDLMVRLFGSLRRMSEMLGIDVGYLSRLRSGEKTDPSDEILKTLGLRRVVTYEPIYRATPLTPRTKSA